ncbi:MAG: endonuclease/exonuclease/phosphatase family protein [Tepidisphaeraceae bacterium]
MRVIEVRLIITVIATMLCCLGCATGQEALAPAHGPIKITAHADEPSAHADSLTVGTYNVHGLRKRDAIRRDLAELDQVTVWCLQEFPYVPADDDEGADFANVLPPGRWHVALIPLNRERNDSRQWESQVIASRFPIERVDVWLLDDGGAKRRAALAARVNVDGRSVLIVNTDHEPSFLAWRDGNAVQTRRLAERLRDGGNDAVVVAGDFNCSGSLYRFVSNGMHVRRVDRALAECGFTPVNTTGSTFRSGFVRARLDRIYARNVRTSAGAIATTSRGSDHLPVWGRFEVQPVAPDRAISGTALAL